MYRSKSHCGFRKQLQSDLEYPELTTDIDLNTKNSEQTLMKYLENQRTETKQFQVRRRKILNTNKKTEIFQLKQSMSYGESQHPSFFQKSIKLQDYFDNFKTVKFPPDPQLNTFDNSKRFLKEMTLVNRKDHFSKLKQNHYKHYKGQHWTYLTNNPQYFGQFDSLPHEESPKHVIVHEPVFKATSVSRPLFSDVEGDKVHLNVPFNAIHDVKYFYGNINPKKFAKPKTSMLNIRQVTKPFFPIATNPGYLQKNFQIQQKNFEIFDTSTHQ